MSTPDPGTAPDPATAAFLRERPRLFGIAYRMLGSVADAEDVLSDAYLAWCDAAPGVDDPPAYLTRTVANRALNRLRTARTRRETYVGPWLPEPLVELRDEPAEEAETADGVSMALLVVLETLSPLERAVFVLREGFGSPYSEIAAALGRGEDAVRQVARRARAHVDARRPRYPASRAQHRDVTETFLRACLGGDLDAMLAVLAPDVVAHTDGGGRRRAAGRPLRGAAEVARFVLGVLRTLGGREIVTRAATVNGAPGLVVTVDGEVDSVVVAEVVDGRITTLAVVRNPDKLHGITALPG